MPLCLAFVAVLEPCIRDIWFVAYQRYLVKRLRHACHWTSLAISDCREPCLGDPGVETSLKVWNLVRMGFRTLHKGCSITFHSPLPAALTRDDGVGNAAGH